MPGGGRATTEASCPDPADRRRLSRWQAPRTHPTTLVGCGTGCGAPLPLRSRATNSHAGRAAPPRCGGRSPSLGVGRHGQDHIRQHRQGRGLEQGGELPAEGGAREASLSPCLSSRIATPLSAFAPPPPRTAWQPPHGPPGPPVGRRGCCCTCGPEPQQRAALQEPASRLCSARRFSVIRCHLQARPALQVPGSNSTCLMADVLQPQTHRPTHACDRCISGSWLPPSAPARNWL